MSYKLTQLKPISAALIMCVALTGCATVDLNQVTRPVKSQIASEAELNIVQRAAAALSMVFRDRGFVAKTSRKRLQSAASVLLNGLEDKQIVEANAQELGYSATFKSDDVIIADIGYARSHVERTVAAAEIYLEIAPANRDLRKELISLEKALLASTEARDVFQASLQGKTLPEFVIYEQSVSNLRAITDEFGARVRIRDTAKLASRGVITGS